MSIAHFSLPFNRGTPSDPEPPVRDPQGLVLAGQNNTGSFVGWNVGYRGSATEAMGEYEEVQALPPIPQPSVPNLDALPTQVMSILRGWTAPPADYREFEFVLSFNASGSGVPIPTLDPPPEDFLDGWSMAFESEDDPEWDGYQVPTTIDTWQTFLVSERSRKWRIAIRAAQGGPDTPWLVGAEYRVIWIPPTA